MIVAKVMWAQQVAKTAKMDCDCHDDYDSTDVDETGVGDDGDDDDDSEDDGDNAHDDDDDDADDDDHDDGGGDDGDDDGDGDGDDDDHDHDNDDDDDADADADAYEEATDFYDNIVNPGMTVVMCCDFLRMAIVLLQNCTHPRHPHTHAQKRNPKHLLRQRSCRAVQGQRSSCRRPATG